MKKRLLTLLLAVILTMSLVVPVSAAFSDVPADAWYAGDVADVQKYGIIEGVGNNKFLPNGILTYAQAVTMASRVHARLTGNTIPNSGEYRFWYEPYLEYAQAKKLINERYAPYDNMDGQCSRAEMAYMFYYAIQGMDNVILNDVTQIPDLAFDNYTMEIYALYRFGILTGSDEYGSFYPGRSITRAETAAILNRSLDVDKRQTFTLKPGSPFYSMDMSSSWTNISHFTYYTEYGEEISDIYETTIAFQTDGKLYGLSYIPEAGDILCFKGTYKLNGDKITMSVSLSSGEIYTATYKAGPYPYLMMSGFTLTYASGDSFLPYNEGNLEWIFDEDDTYTAAMCKKDCLEFW